MLRKLSCLVAVGALSLFVGAGCNKNKDTTTAKSPSGSGSMSDRSSSSTYSAQTRSPYGSSGSGGMTASGDSAAARDTSSGAAADAQRAVDSADAAAARATGTTGATGTAGATGTGAAAGNAPASSGTGDASTAEAQKLMDQATQYIKENKWDLADQSLTKLEQMKSQLPSTYGPKIDATRKMFNTAKSGSGLLGGTTGGAAK